MNFIMLLFGIKVIGQNEFAAIFIIHLQQVFIELCFVVFFYDRTFTTFSLNSMTHLHVNTESVGSWARF